VTWPRGMRFWWPYLPLVTPTPFPTYSFTFQGFFFFFFLFEFQVLNSRSAIPNKYFSVF
jgi:hypothetical protein